jgi:DNA topoisomerase I
MSKLLIVESPGKINKIKEYLGNDYIVMASIGHIMDLDPNNISINLENFEPQYSTYNDKKDQIKKLKNATNQVGKENVLLAADEDREGEMIAWSLAKELKLNNPKRIVFNSITKKELTNAINNPKTIDYNMVYAQQARRILDRFGGYLVSPILNKNGFKGNQSAGRVQSVVVKIIVDKEKEIEEFYKQDKSTYFYINCNMNIGEYQVLTKLALKKTKIETSFEDNNDDNLSENENSDTKKNKSKKNKVNTDNFSTNKSYLTFPKSDEDKVLKIIKKMTKCNFDIFNMTEKVRKSNPSPPFTTSTLQQYASQRLNMDSKRTMSVAQKLYEGGHITYMRTDSTSISEEAITLIKDAIKNKAGINYFEKRSYVNKKANTQEAHECIRPTKPLKFDIEGSTDEKRLYNVIWKRTLQSQMKSAEYQNILIEICMEDNKDYLKNYKLIGTLDNLIYEGYLILDNKKGNSKLDSKKLDKLDWININGIEDTQKPPTRYNEASLINKMDPKNLNIGRPSTYSSFIDKITKRNYVEIKDLEGNKLSVKKFSVIKDNKSEIKIENKDLVLGNEKKKLVPTNLGINITKFLEDNFSKLMDYKFTANMEKELDDVAEGSIHKNKIIEKFYEYLNDSIENIKPSNYSNEIIIGKYNDNDIILKNGPYGKYFTFNKTNIGLKQILNNNNTTEDNIINNHELLIKYIIQEITNPPKKIENISLKEWENGKTKYIMREGKFGHYIEELKNNSKKNYTMKFLVNKKANENNINLESINEILDLITIDEIKDSISVLKEMKKFKKK